MATILINIHNHTLVILNKVVSGLLNGPEGKVQVPGNVLSKGPLAFKLPLASQGK
jgi:hypothetical protein